MRCDAIQIERHVHSPHVLYERSTYFKRFTAHSVDLMDGLDPDDHPLHRNINTHL